MWPEADDSSALPPRRAGPTFWTGDWCATCPAAPTVCGSVGTRDACGSPAEYPATSLHPVNLSGPAPSALLELASLDGEMPPPAVRASSNVLVVTGGDSHRRGDAIRLKTVLALGTNTRRYESRVAVLHGGDAQLIRLWNMRGRVGRLLVERGFSAVVGPAFSTWTDHSPWESVVAVAMSASMAAELSRHLPTVPSLIWRTHRDIDRQAQWLVANSVSAVALHAGSMRRVSDWRWWLDGVRHLAKQFSKLNALVPHVLVNGPSTPERIAAVVAAWPGQTTFVTQQPWSCARHGRVLTTDLSEAHAARDESWTDLFDENCASFRAVVAGIIRAQALTFGRSLA